MYNNYERYCLMRFSIMNIVAIGLAFGLSTVAKAGSRSSGGHHHHSGYRAHSVCHSAPYGHRVVHSAYGHRYHACNYGHRHGLIGLGAFTCPFFRTWAPSAYYRYPGTFYGYGPSYYGRTVYPAAPPGVAVEVQEALAEKGYYRGQIDGIVGFGTRNALRAFQSDQGLPITGVIDRYTLDALDVG